METNMARNAKTDRIIWFSMWFLGSIASYGVAFFPLFYFSVDRRNLHFQNQSAFEGKVAAYSQKEWNQRSPPHRNPKLWTASIILILPVFVLVYLLSKDLVEHERHQREFLSTFYPERNYVPQRFSIGNCALITAVTLGFGVVYWLYKLVNVYNNHFKEQRHIEYELLKLMEAKSHVESV